MTSTFRPPPPSARLLAEFVATGSRAIITCIERPKLAEAWLGRTIDDSFVHDITSVDVDAAGENGEYHSFVFAGPLFRAPISFTVGQRREEGRFLQLDLEPVPPPS